MAQRRQHGFDLLSTYLCESEEAEGAEGRESSGGGDFRGRKDTEADKKGDEGGGGGKRGREKGKKRQRGEEKAGPRGEEEKEEEHGLGALSASIAVRARSTRQAGTASARQQSARQQGVRMSHTAQVATGSPCCQGPPFCFSPCTYPINKQKMAITQQQPEAAVE